MPCPVCISGARHLMFPKRASLYSGAGYMLQAPFFEKSKAVSKSERTTLPNFGGPAAPFSSCVSRQSRRMLSGFTSEMEGTDRSDIP